jgi:signal transduction histidine kinase
MNARGKKKPFHLLRSFAVLSLVSIAVTTSVSAVLVSGFISKHLLERDASVTLEFIQSVADIERLGEELKRPTALQSAEGFGEFFLHVGNMPDVVGAVVYSPDRFVIWSSDRGLVGQQFPENDDLAEALQGKMIYELEHGQPQGAEKSTDVPIASPEFVENYLPIRDADRAAVIAVAEIYKVPRALLRTLAEGHKLVWLTALGGGLFLWAALYWIVSRAAELIRTQQRQLLEAERYAAVGEMAAAVAHGIRNPLASIRSSAELALEAESFDLTRDTATDIISEADRLEKWVKDLLTGSRLEDTSFEKVDLQALAREHMDKLARRLQRDKVSLELDLKPVSPIRGDAPLITQMFDNLVSNALEAMPEGGTLTVCTSDAHDGTVAELAIRDTGNGVPAHIADQIFSPLVTSKRSGMGLGLALVKRIVERHDGEVSVSSPADGGTVARVRFPAVRR